MDTVQKICDRQVICMKTSKRKRKGWDKKKNVTVGIKIDKNSGKKYRSILNSHDETTAA